MGQSETYRNGCPHVLHRGEGERLALVGETVRVLADAQVASGRCFIFEETTPPGGGPPPHRHGVDDEHFYVLEGTYGFQIDGNEITAEPGAFVTAPRGSLHGFRNVGSTPGRMLIVCAPCGLERCFRAAHDAERRGPVEPAKLAEIFAAFDVVFEGVPSTT